MSGPNGTFFESSGPLLVTKDGTNSGKDEQKSLKAYMGSERRVEKTFSIGLEEVESGELLRQGVHDQATGVMGVRETAKSSEKTTPKRVSRVKQEEGDNASPFREDGGDGSRL